MARRRGWQHDDRGLLSALLVAVLAFSMTVGCSVGAPEPGLFGRDTDEAPAPTKPPEDQPLPGQPRVPDSGRSVNPALPVVGEQVWTTADGTGLTIRIAVHAVRRIAGGTVLDWSVTPLRAPGLGPGDVVSSTVNLGLHRLDGGNTNLFLIDQQRRRLYRPLVHRNISRRCLCTPIWRVQRALRIGQTALLQVAFAELPVDVATVDVDIASVPVFGDVGVNQIGEVPRAARPTDLARPPDPSPPTRRLLGDTAYLGQRFRIEIVQVTARRRITSLQWVITSLSAGSGLELATGAPFADPATAISYNAVVASGPVLVVDGQRLRARIVASSLTSQRSSECLCSDLRVWPTSLRDAGREATVITNFAALPADATSVSVSIPGVGERVVDVVRDRIADPAGSELRRVGFWHERELPPSWPAQGWPTAVPDPAQLADFVGVRDEILR